MGFEMPCGRFFRARPDYGARPSEPNHTGRPSRRYGFGVVDGAGVGLVAGALVVAGAGGSVGWWRAQYTTTKITPTMTAAIAYQRRLSKFIATSRTGAAATSVSTRHPAWRRLSWQVRVRGLKMRVRDGSRTAETACGFGLRQPDPMRGHAQKS
jgi:hypothetical protein